jgi:hypothetical protein
LKCNRLLQQDLFVADAPLFKKEEQDYIIDKVLKFNDKAGEA